MKTTFFFILSLAVFTCPAQTKWQKAYAGAPNTVGFSSIATYDGNYMVFGRSDAALLILKLDLNGDTLWTKTTFPGGYIPCAIQTSDTNILFISETSYSSILNKMDLNGSHIWSKQINFPPNSTPTATNSIVETLDGNYVLGGTAVPNVYSFFLTKITPAGDTLWTKMYWNNTGLVNGSLVQTPDSGFFMVGDGGSFPHSTILLRLDSSGDTLFHKSFAIVNELFIRKGINGTYFLAGLKQRPLQSVGFVHNGFLCKLDSSGNVLWARSYGDTLSNVHIYDAVQNNDGSYIFTGYYAGRTGYLKLLIFKVDSIGNFEWARLFGKHIIESSDGNGVIVTGDGGNLAVGKFGSGLDYQLYAIKTDSLGLTGCMDSTIQIIESVDTIQEISSPLLYSSYPFYLNTAIWNETNNCTVSDICAILSSNALNNKSTIILFPNPTINSITLESSSKIFSAEILDPYGKSIYYTSAINRDQINMDCKYFPPGIYFLRAETEHGMVSTKFIKE